MAHPVVADLRVGPDAPLWAPFIEALPVTGASISVMASDGIASTVSTSDGLAARLDEIQLELGEGPHWIAFQSGDPVLVPDVRTDAAQAQWPMFGNAVLDTGALGVFSFPLFVGLLTVGVVDLYSDRAGDRWPARLIAEGTAIAAAAARRAVRLATSSAVSEHPVASAFELRREVHQATGMLVVQLGVPAHEASARLQAHAFAAGRPIIDVARDVVDRTLDLSSA